MKAVIKIIFLCCLIANLKGQNLTKIPLVIKSTSQIKCIEGSNSKIYGYKNGNLIFVDSLISYEAFNLVVQEEFIDLISMRMIDSICITFNMRGIYDQSYFYKIPLKVNSDFMSLSKSYVLDVLDIYNKRRNKKIIDKISFPYLFTLTEYNGRSYEIYSNWTEYYDEIRIKNPPKNNNGYTSFRDRFFN